MTTPTVVGPDLVIGPNLTVGTYTAGPSTPADPTDRPVAGRTYRLRYYPLRGGVPFDPTSWVSLELYGSPQREEGGTAAVVTVPGPPTRLALGEYLWPAALMPAAGTYYARVRYRDGAVLVDDRDDVLVVLAYNGTLEQTAGGRLADLAMFRRLAPTAHRAADVDVVRYLRAADEVAASVVGPLPAVGLPVPEAWREAAVIIAVHLAERHSGAIPGEFGGDTDETVNYGLAYSIPAAALELLRSTRLGLDGLPISALKVQAPQFDFPVASVYPSGW